MLDWLMIATRANPNTLALIEGEHYWTYTELHDEVNRYVRWLHSKGVNAGEHIGVLMPNCAEYVFLIHALIRLGAVLVPLNTRLTSAELAYQVEKVACTLVIYADETRALAQALPVRTVALAETISLALDGSLDDSPSELNLNAPHAILFTSGTTGKPKGAILTYHNHLWSATASAFRIGTLPEDRWLLCLPLYHVGGLNIVLRCCLYGTCVILQRGFDIDAVRTALETQAVSLVSLVPTMLYRLLDTPLNAPTLRLVLLGGAAATPELVQRAQSARIPIATTYGLTEADSQVATQTPSATLRKPGSVGKPVPFAHIDIISEDGQGTANGEIGEIVVTSPTLMQGYYDEATATARTIRDGKLYTGDLGYIDLEGDLWIVQRRSDLIVTGGENVYPAEVESVLKRHLAVAEACVVGIPNSEWGQQVVAAVVLKTEIEAPSAEALIAFCRQSLAGYKVPRQIQFMDSLPMTASGKIERKSVIAGFEN